MNIFVNIEGFYIHKGGEALIPYYLPLLIFIFSFLWKSFQLYKYKTTIIKQEKVDEVIYEYINKNQGGNLSHEQNSSQI